MRKSIEDPRMERLHQLTDCWNQTMQGIEKRMEQTWHQQLRGSHRQCEPLCGLVTQGWEGPGRLGLQSWFVGDQN